MLRGLLAFLTVLIAVSATAQVVSSTEQSYGPYTRPLDGYQPALAVAQDGILLAWSEVVAPHKEPQIRTGMLDFHGRLVSPITTIESEWRATSPIVTSDGTSFRLQYLDGDVPFAVEVDARGIPMGSPRRTPRVIPNPLKTQWQAPICWRPCPNLKYKTLGWTFLGRGGSHVEWKPEEISPVVAGGIPNHLMIAWGTSSGIRYLEYLNGTKVVAEGMLLPASLHSWDPIAIGCDDTHCLLVYTTGARQIYGVLIDPTQPHLAVPVPIETAKRVEHPQVHLLEKGRFLVVYVSEEHDPQHRFAGRIVTTAPLPRRRAVR